MRHSTTVKAVAVALAFAAHFTPSHAGPDAAPVGQARSANGQVFTLDPSTVRRLQEGGEHSQTTLLNLGIDPHTFAGFKKVQGHHTTNIDCLYICKIVDGTEVCRFDC